ncbi:MAG TPA: bifunctional DNA-binding transcriptional regulator/O6-methylguanine-DNA methyltransferase Ada [Casimicrobiaceae bacterium]|jgi:AraC family transcriptional regulator of adaptative response/methylated-DNA-[protein]-cysteine methyltransferase|nr:bifunctional DNA-binding transcriptional regulator/O6-methylguanine-DNA methyltransferase Ada [Casimicrobiaceae bacterium]
MKSPRHTSSRHAVDVLGDPRWAAVVGRDPSQDARFVYAVTTTGIYGRPSSAARLPRPEHVRFFDSPAAAEAAGFRASRHMAGDKTATAAQHAAIVADACRRIEAADEAPDLAALAADAGMSPFHFHRIFKATTGLTPKSYADAHRARRLRAGLDGGRSVTTAIYDAGFNSNSRFYAAADAVLGMKPGSYRAGGRDATIRFAVGECSLGSILVAAGERGVCAILLGDDPAALVRDLEDRFPRATLVGGDADFERVVATVVGFVEAPALGLALPLDVRGTAFQERVWQALREVPAGATTTYSEIAARIGAPKAVRAVAGACAANRLAVAIPCHRVVRRDGDVSGYRWGVARKRALLAREAAAVEDVRICADRRTGNGG